MSYNELSIFKAEDILIKGFAKAVIQWFAELDKLLSLRGLAALAVVVYHVQNYLRPNLNRNVSFSGLDFTWLFTPEGRMPVIIFFTLSGYLMFKAFITKRYKLNALGVVDFYKSRAKRILPLYYFLAFLFLIFVTPKLLFNFAGWHTIFDVFIFNYDGFGGFITPFWSLSVEVKFYILTPLLAFFCIRHLKNTTSKFIALSLIIAVTVAIRTFLLKPGMELSATEQLISVIDAFLIGGFTVFVVEKFKNASWTRKYNHHLLITSFILGISIIPLSSLYFFKLSHFGFDQFGVSVIALLTCTFIFTSELSTRKKFTKQIYTLKELIHRPWILPEFIGALSYGIYLWHAPIIGQALAVPIKNTASLTESLIRAAVIIAISIALAYLTYKYIELYKPRKSDGK